MKTTRTNGASASVTAMSENELVFVARTDLVSKTVNKLSGGRRMFAVTDENVRATHPEILPKDAYVIKAGENSKTFATVESVCRAMLQAGLPRTGIVVAYGGGVVGDIAGFAAAVYMRGVDFVSVPTTLLAQVDSAIGGKAGVNLDGFKNMLGAFKMPTHAVICPALLETLPAREWRCGLGELIKTAVLDEELFAYVQEHIAAIASRDMLKTETAVQAAAAFKKKITDADPTEAGQRVILNLGHTVGHALETCDCRWLSHGEYVMLGLLIELQMTDSAPVLRAAVEKMLAAVELPPLPNVKEDELLRAACKDKKNNRGKINVLGAIDAGKPYIKSFSQKEFAAAYRAAVQTLTQSGVLRRA